MPAASRTGAAAQPSAIMPLFILPAVGDDLKLLLSTLLLALAQAAYAGTPPAPVVVSLAMRDAATLEVSYDIPASCTGLAFLNDGIDRNTAEALRKDWTAADACTLVDSSQLRPAHAGCTSLRVRVPASTLSLDRVYPWAFPLDRGMYLHTMSYAVKDSCGDVAWRFSSPGGTVVADGVLARGTAQRSAVQGDGKHLAVVLLRGAPSTSRLYMDSGFTPQGAVFLQEAISSAERSLRAMLPGLAFTMPYTVATVADYGGQVWGDVANLTVMRLQLAAEPRPDQRAHVQGFVVHELAHLLHARQGKWKSPWDSDQALIDEGGAEFLRWAALARNGWMQPAELRQDLERAVNSCVQLAAGARWHDTRNRGFGVAPYDCGLTFHLLGLAGGSGKAKPLLRLRDHYRKAKLGQATDIARALECGTDKACTPRWLPRLSGSETVETVLLAYAAQPGAMITPGAWTLPALDVARRRYISRLLQLDCQGLVIISHKADFARVGAGLQCGVLREGMELVRAEGLPLYGDALAMQASARACAESGRTVLGLKNGQEVTLACDKSVYVPLQRFSVDIDQALALTR